MAQIYFETDSLKELSNKEFIKRYWQINDLESKSQRKNTPLSMIEQLRQIQSYYENELNRRLDEDIMDEDEVEELYERFDDKFSQINGGY